MCEFPAPDYKNQYTMDGVRYLMTPLDRGLGKEFRTTKLKFNLEERLYYFALSLKSYIETQIMTVCI